MCSNSDASLGSCPNSDEPAVLTSRPAFTDTPRRLPPAHPGAGPQQTRQTICAELMNIGCRALAAQLAPSPTIWGSSAETRIPRASASSFPGAGPRIAVLFCSVFSNFPQQFWCRVPVLPAPAELPAPVRGVGDVVSSPLGLFVSWGAGSSASSAVPPYTEVEAKWSV